jgi:hypothetical protein
MVLQIYAYLLEGAQIPPGFPSLVGLAVGEDVVDINRMVGCRSPRPERSYQAG